MAKRVLVLLMALMLVVSFAFAAKKQLVHYHWTETIYDPINTNAKKAFEAAHPDVEVKLLLLPDGDRINIIRTVLAANGNIDSFALSNGESAEFLSAGQMVPFDPKGFGKSNVQDVVSMWNPGAIETCGGTWDGKYYGVPFELSNYVAWINTAFMKEAGLNPKTDKPKTWDDFATVGKKMVKKSGGTVVRNGFMCNSKAGGFSQMIIYTMMHQLGNDWGSEQSLLASLDKPEVIAKALKTYSDFVVDSKIWDPALSDEDRSGFGTGKSAMFLTGGTWYWGVLDTYSVPRKDVEPFAYPRFKGGKDVGGPGYGYCLYVSRLAKDPVLAFQYLDTMASQPNEFIKQGYHQPRKTLSNGKPGLDPSLATKTIPYYNEVFKGELAKTAYMLSSIKSAGVVDATWAAISRVIYEGGNADDSTATLVEDLKAVYE
jgi:ABC-type glycerol-3-phosphate transport system substrate-binding protein